MRALFFDFLSEGCLALELGIIGERVLMVVYFDLGRSIYGNSGCRAAFVNRRLFEVNLFSCMHPFYVVEVASILIIRVLLLLVSICLTLLFHFLLAGQPCGIAVEVFPL